MRERLGLTQAGFARVLNASAETVKVWEQGKRAPDGMALALLQVADEHPQALMSRVRRKAARSSKGERCCRYLMKRMTRSLRCVSHCRHRRNRPGDSHL